MSLNSTKNQELNTENKSNPAERFVVFVAGGVRPIIACSNFYQAERLALFFAGLVNVRMEVFDSLKEICYFIEPSELIRSFVH